jgi:hypothetical protein
MDARERERDHGYDGYEEELGVACVRVRLCCVPVRVCACVHAVDPPDIASVRVTVDREGGLLLVDVCAMIGRKRESRATRERGEAEA